MPGTLLQNLGKVLAGMLASGEKYSAIFQPWLVDTMPLVNTPTMRSSNGSRT